MADAAARHTLFVCRDVSVYQIPPAPTGRGHRAAEWRTDACVFRGKLIVEAGGDLGDGAEIRLLDSETGALFAVAPVPHGGRAAAVEPALDSSRNFALRLVDGASGRAAVVGLSFAERSDAFDFNVALADHETRVTRAKDGAATAVAVPPAGDASASAPAPAPPSTDFSLKGSITVKKPAVAAGGAGGGGGGLLARAPVAAAGGGVGLPPPPVDPFSVAAPPPPPATTTADPFAPADGGGGDGGGWATFD